MGVLKLSVIEEQNKQLKTNWELQDKKAMLFALVIAIVLVSASLEKAEITMCDDVASAGSWNID